VNTTWSARQHRLIVVSGPGLAGADRIVVSRQDLPADTPGLLTIASAGDHRVGVRLFGSPELPSGVIAVGADLAAEHSLADAQVSWQLTARPAAVASSITLEPMTDGAMQDASRTLLGATDLVDRVLFLDPARSTWTNVSAMPFRVRGAAGADGHELDGLLRIGRDTQLVLYGQSGRTGVDIVILADCSGSMSLEDVPQQTGEDPYSWRLGQVGGADTMERGEAQKRALLRLLDSRLGTSGRVSRVALVRFTTECDVLFPREAGMAEMSADSGTATADAYRRAVTQLRPAGANTDIGGALHYASELLHRHGVPGNDQLIVLISDGADWNPKGVESTGEAVAATTDPVSLMDELYQAAGIRLHAIGISDEPAFLRWWNRHGKRQHEPWMVPDHRLLSDLVRVGGGDPSRIGGLDVLESYFGGLGGGVTTRVGVPARAGSVPPVQGDLAALARRELGIDATRRKDFARRADELRGLYAECTAAAGNRADLRLLRPQRHTDQFAELGVVAQTRTELKGWVTQLQAIFDDRPQQLAPALVPLSADRRLERLRQVRDDAGAPPAEDDAEGWFGLQVQLINDIHELLTAVRNAITEAASAVPARAGEQPAPEWFREQWQDQW
jgi:Mg-chelatase subunit ChlD